MLNKHALMRGYQPPTPTSPLFGRRHERSLAVWQSKAETQRRLAGLPWRQQGYITNDDLLADFTCLCFSPIDVLFPLVG